MGFLNNDGLRYFYQKLKEKFIRSINSQTPDSSGNVNITNVATADNLTSPDGQSSYDYFTYRTSGGSASLTSGEAQLLYVDGNMEINDRVAENFDIVTEHGITVTYSASVWKSYLSDPSTGTYLFNYTMPTSSTAISSSWTSSGTWSYTHSSGSEVSDVNPSTYGIYVANIIDPSISISTTATGITGASVVPSTWFTNVATSGVYTFTYNISDGWSQDGVPITSLSTDYGISVTGTAATGDEIVINAVAGTVDSTVRIDYTKYDPGTIIVATPTSFSATGFNQFNKASMYIADATISNGVIAANSGTYVCYCKAVGGVTNGYGAYSSSGVISNIGWCAELPVIGSNIVTSGSTVTSTLSSVEFDNNGYIVVVVSDMNDLMIHPRWSGSADEEEYTAYVAPSTISLPTEDLEGNTLPIGDYGMPAVGAVTDRLNLDAGMYIQKIGRLPYSAENMSYVQGLDVAYEYDEDQYEGSTRVYEGHIYYVLEEPITYFVDVDPVYIVNDWGTEEFIGTSVAVGAQTLYGQNLRDKLRTDVLTISRQNPALTQAQASTIRHSLLDIIYPIGSIYISTVDTSPEILFGGNWTRITGKFLLAATDGGSSGASQAAGNTGGEATHTLTASEMPSHRHEFGNRASYGTGGVTAAVGYGSTVATGTYYTSYTGGGTSHNNMPPYLAVYMWQRDPDENNS